jgi:hypothetical protein
MAEVNFKVDWYNLRVGRSQAQVDKEIKAIANNNAHAILFQEAMGYDMPGLDGYLKFRDASKKSRANIATYARADLMVDKDRCQWLDLKETWGRTEHSGEHEPRSFYELVIGQVQVINLHQCPKGTDNTYDAQMEGIDKLTNRMKPDEGETSQKRPRIAAGDYNRKPAEDGPGPSMLANRIDGKVSGERIDCLVRRKMTFVSLTYPQTVNGVHLQSDHPYVCRAKFTIDEKWLKPQN